MTKRIKRIDFTSIKYKRNLVGKLSLATKLLKKNKKFAFNSNNSLFASRLKARQVLRAFYNNIGFNQFVRYIDISKKKNPTWQHFLVLLESRLDVLMVRSQFANSFKHSRQLVNHGHCYLNNVNTDIPSANTKIGSFISFNNLSTFNFMEFKAIYDKNSSFKNIRGSVITHISAIDNSKKCFNKFLNKSLNSLFNNMYSTRLDLSKGKGIVKKKVLLNQNDYIISNSNQIISIKSNILSDILTNNKNFIFSHKIKSNKPDIAKYIITVLRKYTKNIISNNNQNILKPYLYPNVYLEINGNLLYSFYADSPIAYASYDQLLKYKQNIQSVLESIK